MRTPLEYVPKPNLLTFLNITKRNGKRLFAMYKCSCGNELEVRVDCVKTGNTKSCGCHKLNSIIKRQTTHNLSDHKLFRIWYGMKERCCNPKNEAYINYGGRGVTICNEWVNDFKAFYDWCMLNGWEQGLELDKDSIPRLSGNDGLIYSPKTCCFLTHSQNNRYRRDSRIIEYNGVKKTLVEWSEIYNIKFDTLWSRLNKGKSIEHALTTPVKVK